MTKIPTAAELKNAQPGQSAREHYNAVHDAAGAHVAAAQRIFDNMTIDGRDKLLASESRDADHHDAQYRAMETLMKQIERDNPELSAVDRRGVAGPLDHTRDRLPLLSPQQRVSDWPTAQAAHGQDDEPVRMGAILRGIITGDRSGMNPAEIRNMSEGTSTAGGHLVPTPTAARFIDRARNAGRVFQAGATTVPMDSMTLKVPRLSGSSAPAWRNENAAVASGDLTLDAVTLTARSLAFMVTMSRELLEDATDPSILDVVEGDLAKQVALEIDRVALRGTGTAPEPRGVRNTSGVTVTAFGGANGSAPSSYDHLIDAVQTVRANNFEPNAQIMSPRSETSLAKLKDTAGNYLAPPAALSGIPRLLTNQIPGNLTAGTSSDTTEVYTGEWPLLYIGIRTGPLFIQLVERYADLGQIALMVWFRGDVALAQPGAFNVTTGVRP